LLSTLGLLLSTLHLPSTLLCAALLLSSALLLPTLCLPPTLLLPTLLSALWLLFLIGWLLRTWASQICTTLAAIASAVTVLCATLWTLSHTDCVRNWEYKTPA
jgi:hypothetical protein